MDEDRGHWRLRPAVREDAPGIRKLIYASRLNPLGLHWRRFVIAEDVRGGLIGCAQIKAHRDGSPELASLAVRRDRREEGIGGALVEHLLQIAPAPLWLTCRSGLVPFYERFGFVSVGSEESQPPYFARARRLVNLLSNVSDGRELLAVMVRREESSAA